MTAPGTGYPRWEAMKEAAFPSLPMCFCAALWEREGSGRSRFLFSSLAPSPLPPYFPSFLPSFLLFFLSFNKVLLGTTCVRHCSKPRRDSSQQDRQGPCFV